MTGRCIENNPTTCTHDDCPAHGIEARAAAARLLSARGASAGGKARALKLSPKRRTEIARKAGRARAAKWKKP